MISALPGWHGLVVIAAGIVATAVLVARSRKRLRGITGDVCGASVEICLTAMLVAASVA